MLTNPLSHRQLDPWGLTEPHSQSDPQCLDSQTPTHRQLNSPKFRHGHTTLTYTAGLLDTPSLPQPPTPRNILPWPHCALGSPQKEPIERWDQGWASGEWKGIWDGEQPQGAQTVHLGGIRRYPKPADTWAGWGSAPHFMLAKATMSCPSPTTRHPLWL